MFGVEMKIKVVVEKMIGLYVCFVLAMVQHCCIS